MECKFHVGQKVVCVREHDPYIRLEMAISGISGPSLRRIYTIRAIRAVCGEPDLLLEEIVNPLLRYDFGIVEQGFSPDRFRPVAGRKTDISQFTAMLTPSKVPA